MSLSKKTEKRFSNDDGLSISAIAQDAERNSSFGPFLDSEMNKISVFDIHKLEETGLKELPITGLISMIGDYSEIRNFNESNRKSDEALLAALYQNEQSSLLSASNIMNQGFIQYSASKSKSGGFSSESNDKCSNILHEL